MRQAGEAKRERERRIAEAQDKIKELVIAEDLEDWHLRASRFADIEEEIEVLQDSKKGLVASKFLSLFIVSLTSLLS